MKKLLSLCLVFLLAVGLSLTVYADSPADYGWRGDNNRFDGWYADDEFNLGVDYSGTAAMRVYKDVLTDRENFLITMNIETSEETSPYVKVLGLRIELDGRGGGGDQIYMKIYSEGTKQRTNYDWIPAEGGVSTLKVQRNGGGDATVTVIGEGAKTPWQVTVPIGEERNDLELGMDAYGWVDFMNITILEGEEAEETVPETTVAEEVPETTEALEETEPETTAVPEETTPVTTAAPEETVPVAPNPGNPGNTALIVGICMMVAALVIVAVVFLRKKK